MINGTFPSYLVTFMLDVALLAGVPLAVATFSGVVVSFFQAITQIQDQSLSQTIKIAAIVIVFLSFGTFLTAPLFSSTTQIFENFDLIVK